jgi:hypothetical protein
MSQAGPGETEAADIPHILVLGTAEWDAPIATNQHYVVRELARLGRVTYVESLGLRRPKWNRSDLGRMAGRLRRATATSSPSPARPRPARTAVVSPLVIPWHRRPSRPVNTALLRRSLGAWTRVRGRRLLWSFTPVTYGMEAHADAALYHCVDLLSEFPGIDRVAVRRGEDTLARKGVPAIGTSGAVSGHLRQVGFEAVTTLTNVAETAAFSGWSRPAAERTRSVLFAGNLTPHKLDTELLAGLAAALRGRGQLLLAGPVAAGGGSYEAELDRLAGLGARHLGLLPLEELAKVAGTCAAGIIPYAVNDYTTGVSPLKCFEYLSSGLAVIGTALPEVERLAGGNPHVLSASGDAFIAGALAGLTTDDDRIAQRIDSAGQHGWATRGDVLRDLARTLLWE